MINALPTPLSTAIRGSVLILGGVVGFTVVLAAAMFAMAMTLVLIARRPIVAMSRQTRGDGAADQQLRAAPAP
jgi:hypothetical protein